MITQNTMAAIKSNPIDTPSSPPLMWCLGCTVVTATEFVLVAGCEDSLTLIVGSCEGVSAMPLVVVSRLVAVPG